MYRKTHKPWADFLVTAGLNFERNSTQWKCSGLYLEENQGLKYFICSLEYCTYIKGVIFGGPSILSEFYGKLNHTLRRALCVQDRTWRDCYLSALNLPIWPYNKKQTVSAPARTIDINTKPKTAFWRESEPTQWILHVSTPFEFKRRLFFFSTS